MPETPPENEEINLGDDAPRSELQPGQKIANRYKIIRALGQGGMGTVYLVEDIILDAKNVALKILHREYTYDKQHTKRFLREVKLMHKVNHINVARTFDVGSDGNLVYFTMEFIQGKAFDLLLDTNQFPKEKTISIVSQMCEGLEAIHNAGIVHRDLKPANIILLDDGTVKITDFGVARPKSSDLTAHNEIVGSAAYVAPEIWEGEAVAPSADIYSLGIIVYELATGLVPFDAEHPAALMRQHLQEAPISPKEINKETPAWFSRLILKLLEKSPKDRFKSAGEVLDYISQYQLRGYLYHNQGDEFSNQGPCASPEFLFALEEMTEQRTSGEEISINLVGKHDSLISAKKIPVRTESKSGPSLKSKAINFLNLASKQFAFSLLTGLTLLGLILFLSKLSAMYTGDPLKSFSWIMLAGFPKLLKSGLLLSLPAIMLSSFSRSLFQVLRASFLSLTFVLIASSMITISLLKPVIQENSQTSMQQITEAGTHSLEQLSGIVLLSPYTNKFKSSLIAETSANTNELGVKWVKFSPLSSSPLNFALTFSYFALLISILYKIICPSSLKLKKSALKLKNTGKNRMIFLCLIFCVFYAANFFLTSHFGPSSKLTPLSFFDLSLSKSILDIGAKNWLVLLVITFFFALSGSKKSKLGSSI